MADLFNVEGFLFFALSMCQCMTILAILWSAAHHFVKEDLFRSARQKQRIIEGVLAGLVAVAVFILPVLVIKYAVGKDLVGQNRSLMMGFYQTVGVVLFTWVGFQLLFMFEDGVARSAKQNHLSVALADLSAGEKIKRPQAARLDDKADTPQSAALPTSQTHDSLASAMEKLFPTEKRGLTFMHFICSTVTYFLFLEPHLYVMQYSGEEAKALILPFFCGLLIAVLVGSAVVFVLNRVHLLRLFCFAFVIILATASVLTHRATTNFLLFMNVTILSEDSRISAKTVTFLTVYSSMMYWIVIGLALGLHYFLKKSRR